MNLRNIASILALTLAQGPTSVSQSGQVWQLQKLGDLPKTLEFPGEVLFPQEKIGWAFDRKHLWRTKSGGKTWESANPPRGQSAAEGEPIVRLARFNSEKQGWILIGCELFLTVNGSITWQRISAVPLCSPDSLVTDVVFAAPGERGVLAGGQMIHDRSPATQLAPTKYRDPKAQDRVLRAALYITRDGGRTWAATKVPSSDYVFKGLQAVTDSTFTVRDTVGIYVSGSDLSGWIRGLVRPECVTRFFLKRDVSDVELEDVSFSGGNGWAVYTDGELLVSKDGGRHWCEHSRIWQGVRPRPVVRPRVAFVDAEMGAALDPEGMVYATKDGGLSWERVYTTGQISHLIATRDRKLIVVGSGAERTESRRARTIYSLIHRPQ